MKIPEFLWYLPEKLTKLPNVTLFLPENARILHNNCPKNIFSRNLGGTCPLPSLSHLLRLYVHDFLLFFCRTEARTLTILSCVSGLACGWRCRCWSWSHSTWARWCGSSRASRRRALPCSSQSSSSSRHSTSNTRRWSTNPSTFTPMIRSTTAASAICRPLTSLTTKVRTVGYRCKLNLILYVNFVRKQFQSESSPGVRTQVNIN